MSEFLPAPAALRLTEVDSSGPSRAHVDPVALLLADKRSDATKRAYEGDLRQFFGGKPAPDQVLGFVGLPEEQVALRLATYKAELLRAGQAEATINRRLSAVRSLLKFCRRLGLAKTDGRGLVDGERVQAYRDTRGISLEDMRRLVRAPGTDSLAGLRDTAMLLVLCENALRRAELVTVDVAHFDPRARELRIRGKGRGTQREPVTLSTAAVAAISAYLAAAGHVAGPLFRNLDHRAGVAGGGLTTDGLYYLIGHYGAAIGIPKLTPHKLRHSAITAALDLTGGDVRKVQKLSRHARLETLQRYDDNRSNFQGEVTGILSAHLQA